MSTGKEIVEKIDFLLKEKNIKRQALADFANFNVANITHWKNRNSIPAADTAIKIAEYLGVSVEWLITGKDPDGLSDQERKLLADWRALDVPAQEIILPMIENAASKARQEKKENAKTS